MKDISLHIEELESECNYLAGLIKKLQWQRETLIDVIEGFLTEQYSEEAIQIAMKEAKTWSDQDMRRKDH